MGTRQQNGAPHQRTSKAVVGTKLTAPHPFTKVSIVAKGS